MISIRNIHKTFYRGGLPALDGVSIEIPEGEFLVLIGSNGSGKSTLLNTIAGNLFPDSGNIIIEGRDVTSMPDFKRTKWISRVFQNPLAGTAPELSVIENFRLAALRTVPKTMKTGTTAEFKNHVSDKIAELNLGLESKLYQPMGSLSGGQRQALTLLMAVMDDTKLLLMDEPVSALDPRTAELVMKLSDELIARYSLTAILVTHSLRDAHHYGNRIIQMSEGKVVKDLSGNEKKNLTLETLYSWF